MDHRLGAGATLAQQAAKRADMPLERIQQRFAASASLRRRAVLPYFTSGFPDASTVEAMIRRADDVGATVVELGIPFSDSIADGRTIQRSFHDVLKQGWTVEDTFQLVARVRPRVECALVAMVSYSLVWRIGVQDFMNRAARCGFDGVIVPDVPVEESMIAAGAAGRADLGYVGLVAPTTTSARRKLIARSSTGFVYRIAISGTTGERTDFRVDAMNDIDELRDAAGAPVCVGFGISTAEQVGAACVVADGAIVGSAIVRRIADAVDAGQSMDDLVDTVGGFLSELITGAAHTA